jgi:hypothetical protein
MDMKDLLVALHPKPWRERYGDEFRVLLDDSGLTPRAVLDVLAHAAKLQVRERRTPVLVAGAIVASGTIEHFALRAGLTDNILWAPTTPRRALALAATLAPWAALLVRTHRRRRRPT